jgi:biotin-(acetyl-CoA carboxylase) ligase
MAGRRVRVHSFSGSLEGTIAGIDDDGTLLLTGADGDIERVIAGDVEYIQASGVGPQESGYKRKDFVP